MGRCDELEVANPQEFNQKVMLQAMVMVDGDYDQGGAYWGCWSRTAGGMFRAYYYDQKTGDSVDMYIRATSREKAKAQVNERLPKARFYR